MNTPITSHDRHIADTTANVTFALIDALETQGEANLPGGDFYRLFSGIPGFIEHAAAAGLALARVLSGDVPANFAGLTDEYACRVLNAALAREIPADNLTLRQLAEDIVATYRTRDGH